MTTDTAALLRHLADVLTALQPARWYIQNPDKRRDFWAASTRLAQLLDLHEGAALVDIAPHVRAHADSLAPGLPEGWGMTDCGTETSAHIRYSANGPGLSSAAVYRYADGRIVVSGTVAPPAVYAYLLARAQGVGS